MAQSLNLANHICYRYCLVTRKAVVSAFLAGGISDPIATSGISLPCSLHSQANMSVIQHLTKIGALDKHFP